MWLWVSLSTFLNPVFIAFIRNISITWAMISAWSCPTPMFMVDTKHQILLIFTEPIYDPRIWSISHLGSPCELPRNDAYILCLLFSLFWCFDVWGLADPGGAGPPKISQFLKIRYNLLRNTLFKCKATNSELTPQPPFFFFKSDFHTLSHYTTSLITPGSRYQITEWHPCLTLKIIQTNQSLIYLTCHACSFLQ